MAKLPRIKQEELIASIGVIRQPDAGAGLMTAGRALGAIGAEASADAERTAVAEATLKGREAVTRDENGDLVVQPLPAPDTPANRAFIAAAETGFVAQFADAQQRAAADTQVQHRYDPDGFDATWKGRTEGTLAAVPREFRPRAQDILSNLGQETRNGILIRTQERDYQNSASAWNQQVEQAQSDLAALAAGGDVSSPAYLKAAQNHEELLRAGTASRFINDDRARVLRETVADEGEALVVSREALDAYTSAGRGTAGIKAAQERLGKILDDPGLSGISEGRRRQIVAASESRLRDAEAVRVREAQEIRDEAGDALTKLRLGYPVPAAEIDRHARRARAVGDTEFAARLDREAVLQTDISAFGKRPLTEQAQTIRDLDATLQAGGGSAEDALRVQGYLQAHNAKAHALSDDAWSYGTKAHRNVVGDVTAIDWSAKPEEVSAMLQSRLHQAETLGNLEGVTVLPLSKEEIGRLSGVIAASDERQKAQIGAVLADGLGPRHLPRVLGELIKKDGDARLFATASGIALESPDLARRIHRGAAIARENPKVLPENNLAMRTEIDAKIGTALVRRPDMRAAIGDATLALYADAANQAGDFKGTLDTARLNAAMAEVTGGVVTFRGQQVIVPRRGMDQTGFDEIMAGLQDRDLGAAPPVAADGSPVTAQMIRDYGTLYSVGDGTYEVQVRGFDVSNPADPRRRWTLDLRNVTPGRIPLPSMPAQVP